MRMTKYGVKKIISIRLHNHQINDIKKAVELGNFLSRTEFIEKACFEYAKIIRDEQ